MNIDILNSNFENWYSIVFQCKVIVQYNNLSHHLEKTLRFKYDSSLHVHMYICTYIHMYECSIFSSLHRQVLYNIFDFCRNIYVLIFHVAIFRCAFWFLKSEKTFYIRIVATFMSVKFNYKLFPEWKING